MIEFLKTDEGVLNHIDSHMPGCWVNVVEPTADERQWLQDELGILPEFVASATDDEESAHVDFDDDTHQVLIIIDCPFVEDAQEAESRAIVQYDTHPLSVVFVPEHDLFVTVSLRPNDTVNAITQGRVKNVNTNQKTRTFLRMMLNITQRYLIYLRSIDRQFNQNEKILRKTMQNDEIIKMLGFEKSLVYFSTALRADEAMLTKIGTGRFIKLYEDDRDLLDDVFIELRQAMEMSSILTSILNGTMETFSSVISNTLNSTMKTLTIVTLVLAMPTIVFSFYGMNTLTLPLEQSWWIPFAMSVVIAAAAGLFFAKSRLFK